MVFDYQGLLEIYGLQVSYILIITIYVNDFEWSNFHITLSNLFSRKLKQNSNNKKEADLVVTKQYLFYLLAKTTFMVNLI